VRATIPGQYTDTPYPVLYYFEFAHSSAQNSLYPGLGRIWRNSRISSYARHKRTDIIVQFNKESLHGELVLARDGERRGPVPLNNCAQWSQAAKWPQPISRGRGMASWKPVSQIAELAPPASVQRQRPRRRLALARRQAPAPPNVFVPTRARGDLRSRPGACRRSQTRAAGQTSASSAAEVQLEYMGTQMPPRAEENLKGHARPAGDLGTWRWMMRFSSKCKRH